MARNANRNPVTAKMYRHFAAVTVACTMALAMFADGENREAVAREVSAAAPKRTEANRTPVEFVRKNMGSQGNFNDGFDGSFGAPMDTAGATAGDTGYVPDEVPVMAGSGMPGSYNVYGVPAADWARLSDEQKKKLIAAYKAAQAAARQPDRADQIESLLNASRERSGGEGSFD